MISVLIFAVIEISLIFTDNNGFLFFLPNHTKYKLQYLVFKLTVTNLYPRERESL